jgi:tetratricopeptide (TPR) repeat protein
MSYRLFFYPGSSLYQIAPPAANPQLPAHPVQQYIPVFPQFNTPVSLALATPQVLHQVLSERTTQIAQSTLWGVPTLPPTLNLPVLPVQAVSSPSSSSRKKPHANHPQPALRQEQPTFSTNLASNNGQTSLMLVKNGASLLEQSRYEESLICFRMAFTFMPNAFFPFHLLPECHRIIDKIRPQVLRHVEAALTLSPNDPSSLLMKALCHIRPGEYAVAQKALELIVAHNPADHMASVLLEEVSRINRRGIPSPPKALQQEQASVKRRMAITRLLTDEDTTEEENKAPKAGTLRRSSVHPKSS